MGIFIHPVKSKHGFARDGINIDLNGTFLFDINLLNALKYSISAKLSLSKIAINFDVAYDAALNLFLSTPRRVSFL
jgi:hypothetical protein